MNANFMLQGATKLTKSQMKNVKGGAGNCCAYNSDWTQPGFTCLNHGGNAAQAEFMATDNGWWGCNTPTIIAACGC